MANDGRWLGIIIGPPAAVSRSRNTSINITVHLTMADGHAQQLTDDVRRGNSKLSNLLP